MRVTLLGTGTPAPSLKRQSSGYLIDIGSSTIVVDHGPGAHHRLLEAGRHATEVTHTFFSHLHYDHCLDYARLVLQRWDMGADRIADLEVFGPPPLAHQTRLLFGDDGVFDVDIRARLHHRSSQDVFLSRGGTLPRKRPAPNVTEVHAGTRIDGPDWTVTVGHACHVQPYLECLAFRLDCDAGSVCYSGDSGPCPELISLARDCDVLIHMNHHFSGTEPTAEYRAACGNHRDNAVMAATAGVRTLVLTHLLPQIDKPGIRERVVREVAEVYDGRVIWGEDLMVIDVSQEGVASIEA